MEITSLEQANDFRMRVVRGEALTDEEIAAAILWLRQERVTAKPKPKKEAKPKAAKPNAVTLDELEIE